jgi:hypothetical protein
MTLIIQKPTGAKLVFSKSYSSAFADADVQAYLTAVETADGQALEYRTAVAINDFVLGCKADGIWTAIKASCILAGARTLTGALVPLVGAAPTNVGGLFVSGDYDRKTGLVGDGSSKYLNSNRNNNIDPQNSKHLSVYATTANSVTVGTNRGYIGAGVNQTGTSTIFINSSSAILNYRINSSAAETGGAASATGFIGLARSGASSTVLRSSLTSTTGTAGSQTPLDQNIIVFGRDLTPQADGRLAFYSIGESLNLALLDARVTDLINAFAAAIL